MAAVRLLLEAVWEALANTFLRTFFVALLTFTLLFLEELQQLTSFPLTFSKPPFLSSMRGGPGASTRGPSEGSRYPGGPSAGGAREELPTLRVTNVAEDVEEDDLRELFEKAVGHLRNNRVARVYVGKDRETGAKKGYAFVSFESREVAEYARQKVDGQGYSNLILNVAFSQPREPRPAA